MQVRSQLFIYTSFEQFAASMKKRDGPIVRRCSTVPTFVQRLDRGTLLRLREDRRGDGGVQNRAQVIAGNCLGSN